MKKIETKVFWKKITQLPRKQNTLLVGIDGVGGSGKSTLAMVFAKLSPDVQIVHIDDFYLPSNIQPEKQQIIGDLYDWRRLKTQVLKPLSENRPAKYQIYNWSSDRLEDWVECKPEGIILIEGVFTTSLELRNYYDFLIWVDCPRGLRLERGLNRDGKDARSQWENIWMPAEDRYIEQHNPKDNANVIVYGQGIPNVDPSDKLILQWNKFQN
ncbi:MAG: uridine kinase family protein [bacterium]